MNDVACPLNRPYLIVVYGMSTVTVNAFVAADSWYWSLTVTVKYQEVENLL